MLYRVLALAILSGLPAAADASPLHRMEPEQALDGFAALTENLAASGSVSPPHPIHGGGAAWDPLGAGCIDMAEPAAWTPEGVRDPAAGTFCLANPCERLLTADEMEDVVLGRPVRPEEWDIYTVRQARECASELAWNEELIRPALTDPESWAEYRTAPGMEGYGAHPPAASPSRSPAGETTAFGPGGWNGGSRFQSRERGDPMRLAASRPDDKKAPDDGDAIIVRSPEPGPVALPAIPLPGSVALLAGALAALAALRRRSAPAVAP